MTKYVLEIKLLSPLTSAAGEGRVGLVDRDVVFDDLGLPILPGRRLKGLWRDAYRDVMDAWQQCQEAKTSVEQIFGESGQAYSNGDACLHVANAELKNASSLKKWLEYLQHHKNRKLHVDDVMQYHATVRAQTAIDRRSGSAKENSLRLTRTLKSDLVFRAPVHFAALPNVALENALALGAVALQYMGTARTRGIGKVCCRLLKLDNGNLIDLTPPLNQNSLPSINGAYVVQPAQNSSGQASPFTGSIANTSTHILRYRLNLTAAAVIPIADGDPNTVVTRQDIPGSHLWGAAAWHYLNQANHTPTDKAFRRTFLDGGLRFLTAYPEAIDTQQRLIPIPHSLRRFKDIETEELVDFVEQPSVKRPTKRFEHHYARMGEGILYTQSVKTERNYHHARALKNRRIGRALGAEVPDGGALFTYEAIQAEQTFQGAVLGSAHDLNNLKMWLQNLKTVSIGRSRSAQYGKAEFEWIDSVPQPLSKLAEWDGFVTQQAPPNRGKSLIITTLSPLLTFNNYGHPDACFPVHELANVLGVDSSDLPLMHSYTRTEMISGYHTHLRLPRQQWPAIAASSVFIFDISAVQEHITEDHRLRLEHNGLGVRKAEGYGRVAVNRQGDVNEEQIIEVQLDDPDKAATPNAPNVEINSELEKLLRGIIRTRCMAEMQKNAMSVAKQIRNVPSNSLLGRLRQFIQQDPSAAIKRLSNLRKPAMDSLMDCRINTRSLGNPVWLSNNLYALFENTWQEPEKMTEKIIEDETKRLLKDGDADSTREILIEQLKTEDSVKMCKAFLNHLLTSLYRR